MNIEEINVCKIDFEVSLMTLITQLNQSGVPYNTIRDLIEISVNNCIKRYDKNRDLLTTVFKKLENNEISINQSNKPEISDKNYGFIVEKQTNDLSILDVQFDHLEKDDIMNCFILHKEIRKSRL